MSSWVSHTLATPVPPRLVIPFGDEGGRCPLGCDLLVLCDFWVKCKCTGVDGDGDGF